MWSDTKILSSITKGEPQITQIKKIVPSLQLTNFTIKYFAKNAKKLLIGY